MQNERGSAARRRTTGVQSVARGRSGQTQPARVAGGAPSLPMRAATTPHVLSTPSTPSTASVPSTGMSEMTSTVDDEPTIIATTHETQETPPAAEESGETVETPATAVETPHTDEVNAAAPPAAAPAVMPTITTPVSAGEPEPVNPPQQSQQSPQPAQEQLQQGQPAHAAPYISSGPRQNEVISYANAGLPPSPAWQMPPSMQRPFPQAAQQPQPHAAPHPQNLQNPQFTHVPWQVADSWGTTTLNISTNTAAGASYLFWWVSGLLVYFSERNNRFVRFHALQSVILTSILTVCAVCDAIFAAIINNLAVIEHQSVFVPIGWGVVALLTLAIIFLWLLSMVAAWTGNYLRLPVIGAYAERYAAPPVQPSRSPFF